MRNSIGQYIRYYSGICKNNMCAGIGPSYTDSGLLFCSCMSTYNTTDPLFPFPLTAMETILWSLIEYLTITHYYRTKTNETNELYVND